MPAEMIALALRNCSLVRLVLLTAFGRAGRQVDAKADCVAGVVGPRMTRTPNMRRRMASSGARRYEQSAHWPAPLNESTFQPRGVRTSWRRSDPGCWIVAKCVLVTAIPVTTIVTVVRVRSASDVPVAVKATRSLRARITVQGRDARLDLAAR